MEKTIVVDGHEVRLRSSAGLPRLYRLKFRRDIIQDMAAIQKAIQKSEKENPVQPGEEEAVHSSIPLDALEMFENIAYLMAKHADPSIPSSVEEWLDGFETFSIYSIFPVIQELWTANMKTLSIPAKK